MNKEILVVTATLGDRDSLHKTVESVQKHGLGKVDHVIITPSKHAEKIKSLFPGIIVLEEPSDCKGIYGALNFAFESYASNYTFCTYLNDDDYWEAGYEKIINHAVSGGDFDVMYGKVQYVDEEGECIGVQPCTGRSKSFIPLLFANIVLFTQQATLIKTELFFKIGGFDRRFKLVSDTYFWVNALNSGASFKYLSSICASYTIQDGQLSSNKELQTKEHSDMLAAIGSVKSSTVKKEVILFRLLNLSTYFLRLFKFGSIFKNKKMEF